MSERTVQRVGCQRRLHDVRVDGHVEVPTARLGPRRGAPEPDVQSALTDVSWPTGPHGTPNMPTYGVILETETRLREAAIHLDHLSAI